MSTTYKKSEENFAYMNINAKANDFFFAQTYSPYRAKLPLDTHPTNFKEKNTQCGAYACVCICVYFYKIRCEFKKKVKLTRKEFDFGFLEFRMSKICEQLKWGIQWMNLGKLVFCNVKVSILISFANKISRFHWSIYQNLKNLLN